MSESFVLFSLSAAMLCGCYIAGMVPLSITLSEEKLQLVSTLGAGLLVGTALSVIIPEGVNALYSSVRQISFNHSTPVVLPIGHHHDQGHGTSEHAHMEPHAIIGVTLVLGFVFMLLVDQWSQRRSTQDLNDASRSTSQQPKMTATVGLVVHAAADGIALGAAASTSHREIELIVFFAIMLHKAPAAFALVTFLLHEGFDRSTIKRHLIAFSLAAPLLSITTYLGLSQSTKERMATMNATGVAMLFSAGTFLYVATVHVLPEIANSRPPPYLPVSDTALGKTPHHHHGGGVAFTKKQLFFLVVGALLPPLLTLGHHH